MYIRWYLYPIFFWFILEKHSFLLSCCNYLQHLTFDIKYDSKVIIWYQHYLQLKSGNLSALRLVAFSAYITFLEFTVNRHDLIYRDITHYKKWVNKEGIEPQNILRALGISQVLFWENVFCFIILNSVSLDISLNNKVESIFIFLWCR